MSAWELLMDFASNKVYSVIERVLKLLNPEPRSVRSSLTNGCGDLSMGFN